MAISLDKVKADIRSGKSTRIYICSKSMWWTHLESDLPEAFLAATKHFVKAYSTDTAYSPIGEPVIVNKDPERFIVQTQLFKKKFGKHGLKAFMRAHHQNEAGHFYNKWQRYNDLIDKDNKLKMVTIYLLNPNNF